MKSPLTLLTVLMLLTSIYVGNLYAAPYQFEARVSLSKADTTSPGGFSQDTDTQGISATYYLMPVSVNNGPLAERAFVSKSASITGRYSMVKPEQGTDRDLLEIDTRFVTQTDMIFEFDYEKTDYDSNTDSTADYSFGIGKYLDNRTTAVLTYEHVDYGSDNGTNLRGTYRRLVPGNTPGTHISYGFGLAYIKVPNDSGFQLNASGTYYFSDILSGFGGFTYADVGDSDTKSFFLGGGYFFSETLFGTLSFSQRDFSSGADSSSIFLGLGMRF